MKRLIPLLALVPAFVFPLAAASEEFKLDSAPIDVRDVASLQSGARTFVNYCLSCHSASMMRYNRLEGLGLAEPQIRDNLLFTTDKVGELMSVAMVKKDAKEWFGVAPPDLSVIARSRGADWLYTYLRTFYRDPKTVSGWNNLAFPNVAMPHVLWTLSGQSVLDEREFKTEHEAEAAKLQSRAYSVIEESDEGAEKRYVLKTTKLVTAGTLTPLEYDAVVRDLVNFLVWMSEPNQTFRKQVGIVVTLVLLVLLVLTYLLYKEFWKDVH